jgi:hypothetical protein
MDIAKRESQERCLELKTAIASFSSNALEEAIKAKIAAIEAGTADRIKKSQQQKDSELNGVREVLQQEKAKLRDDIAQIKSEIVAEETEMKHQCDTLDASKNQVMHSMEHEIADIQAESEKAKSKLVDRHGPVIAQMKLRLESASKTRQDVLDRFEGEKSSVLKRSRDELDQKRDENAKSNSHLFADVQGKSQTMNDKIVDLSRQISAAELRASDPHSRRGDKKRIEVTQGKITSLDEETEKTFQGFSAIVIGAPAKVNMHVREPETPRAMSFSGREVVKSGSRTLRRENSRVFTPVESKHQGRRRPSVTVNTLAV